MQSDVGESDNLHILCYYNIVILYGSYATVYNL